MLPDRTHVFLLYIKVFELFIGSIDYISDIEKRDSDVLGNTHASVVH